MNDLILHQEGSHNYQAGRDLYVPMPEDEISEPEFREIIRKFISIQNLTKVDDFKIVDLSRKNQLNLLSPKAFEHIKQSSIVSYDHIDSLLKNPNNTELQEDFANLVASLQNQYIMSNLRGKIERFFTKTYQFFANHCSTTKERNWGMQLVYFMYLRCDIGLK